MKPVKNDMKQTDTVQTDSPVGSSSATMEPRVVADLLEEVLEERGNDDRRQGVLPDRTPEVDRRSSVPRRNTDQPDKIS